MSEPSGDDPDRDPAWVVGLRSRLIAWYREHHRDLPWRRTRDPYAILVSEVMLVQTTVAAVVPFYERFLVRFPDVAALAEADEADVLKAWEGLGYYRRARQLHAAARAIVAEHGGTFPRDPKAILDLPGVGRYIAGAIRSFAFDQAAPILEANTQRVMARWLAWDRDLLASASQARLWEAAARTVDPADPATFNQAFMELGALVCRPVDPLCLLCPARGLCLAERTGRQRAIPVIGKRNPPKVVAERSLAIRRGADLLVVKRPDAGLWAGFWEFPTFSQSGPNPAGRPPAGADAGADARDHLGLTISSAEEAFRFKYTVTTHQVECAVVAATWQAGAVPIAAGRVAEWADPAALARRPLTGPARTILRRLKPIP